MGKLGTKRFQSQEKWGVAGRDEGSGEWGGGGAANPPGPSTHLLLNVCQRLDGQIRKGREGLVGRGRSVLGGGP